MIPILQIILCITTIQALQTNTYVQQRWLLTTLSSKQTTQTSRSNTSFKRYITIKDNDYSASEAQDMETLIMSLSYEQNDQTRRKKLLDLFQNELSKPCPERFTNLFDAVLIDVGNKVRLEAIEKFESNQTNVETCNNNNGSSNTDQLSQENDGVNREAELKTREEIQIWALIDMMVQSKTLVKKSNGQLSREGSFG